jgi:hypothetical protein
MTTDIGDFHAEDVGKLAALVRLLVLASLFAGKDNLG